MKMTILYVVLFILGIKFYFWGRKEQDKRAPKWGWRLTILFFLAPLIIFFIDIFLPVPDGWIHILKITVKYMDYPVNWIYVQVQPHLNWWSVFTKPAIAACFYGFIGFIIGSLFDITKKEKQNDQN